MDSLAQIGVFFAEALIIFLVIGGIILMIAMAALKGKNHNSIEIDLLHKKYKEYATLLRFNTLNKSDLKAEKKKLKEESKKEDDDLKNKIYVLDFDGDIKASQAENLREEITAVLTVATPQDEVVIRLESPGGVVHGYGFAASQILRLREKNIPITVCVDYVAASGGYLMSCVANQIIAAPFAILGSIGVVAQVPNFYRFLRKHDVDYKEYTAGNFKRTVSLLGEITEKGEQKFKEQLEDTHALFKTFVGQFRPQLNMDEVATGEYWYGLKAKQLGLVDKIETSDDYLMTKSKDSQIIHIKYQIKESFQEKISSIMGQAFEKSLLKIWALINKQTLQ